MGVAEILLAGSQGKLEMGSEPVPLWKDGGFVTDRFLPIAEETPLAFDIPATVSLARWRNERSALLNHEAPLALLIRPGEDWEEIGSDLSRFATISVSIAKFSDGRAFSIGRLIRERWAFGGELRAIGIFILDQMPLLCRVGFDAFEIRDPILRRQLESGAWPEVTAYLQPIDAARETPAGTRPWARRRAKEVGRT